MSTLNRNVPETIRGKKIRKKTFGLLSLATVSLMLLSMFFFLASEVAQIAIKVQTQGLLAVTILLGVAFLTLNYLAARLSPNQKTSPKK